MKVRQLQAMLAEMNPEREVVLHFDTEAAARVMRKKLDLDDRHYCSGEQNVISEHDGELDTIDCEHEDTQQDCGPTVVTDQMFEIVIAEMERMIPGSPKVAVGRGSHGPIVALRIGSDVSPEVVLDGDAQRAGKWHEEQIAYLAERSARQAAQAEADMRHRAATAMRNRIAV